MAGRKPRPVPLTPEENRFRLDEWIDRNLIVEDKSGPEWLCVCPACGRTKLAVHVGRKAYHCFDLEAVLGRDGVASATDNAELRARVVEIIDL